MKTHAVLKNILDHETIFDGEAGLDYTENSSLVLTMKNEEGEMVWKLLSKGIRIENRSREFVTVLNLFEKGYGKAKITTPYGVLDCQVEDVKIACDSGRVRVSYLLNGADLFSFELTCSAIQKPEDSAAIS